MYYVYIRTNVYRIIERTVEFPFVRDTIDDLNGTDTYYSIENNYTASSNNFVYMRRHLTKVSPSFSLSFFFSPKTLPDHDDRKLEVHLYNCPLALEWRTPTVGTSEISTGVGLAILALP